jgi:hypothetical protein
LCVLTLLAGTAAGGLGFWRGGAASLDISAVAPFPFTVALDRLSAFFLLLICVVAAPVTLFSGSYGERHYQGARRAWLWALLPLFLGSMVLVVTASTAFAFLFGWELMTLFSAGLILIDGGLGQLHAAAESLESIGISDQPLASIAKREEIIYVYGQEDEPVALDRFSPILHLIQSIRDEAHRFAVTFHRTRRNAQRLTSELAQIEGVGPKTVKKLLRHFGSPELVKSATDEELAALAGPAVARNIRQHYAQPPEPATKEP